MPALNILIAIQSSIAAMKEKIKNIEAIEQDVIRVLKNIYDPEIPVNIYDLGLIYAVNVEACGKVVIDMTLTAPTCPIADQIVENVRSEVGKVPKVKDTIVQLTFEPPWNQDMISEEAKMELGLM
jgi:FeS assembly SUF system protein